MELVFGTYRLKGEVLEIAASQAIHSMTQHGIASPLLDSALLYNNASTMKALLCKYPNMRIGTKLHRAASIDKDLEQEHQHYGPRLFRVLLHQHLPTEAYLALVRAKAAGIVKEIGVSNYAAPQLRALVADLERLDAAGDLPLPLEAAMPDVCQNEFHPFLRTTVPAVCAELGIRFEAHSIFALLDEYPNDLGQPGATVMAAQAAMAFALQRGGGSVVFNTANYKHLIQNLDLITLDEPILQKLDALKSTTCHARYSGSESASFRPQFMHHEERAHAASGFASWPHDFIRDVIAPRIKEDAKLIESSGVPTTTANGIPHLRLKDAQLKASYLVLARAFFTDADGNTATFFEDPAKDDDSKLKRLELQLTKIRRAVLTHKAEMKAKSMVCKAHAVEEPEALPVDIPDPTVIQPFIDLVAEASELPATAIRMERGVLFPDGRLDFCKQVSLPLFPQLCDAVLRSGIVKHFLIGNNIALANDKNGSCERALARLITKSRGIVTFYLAGNAISKHQIASIAEALSGAEDVRYVWLKMNPIQTGSYHLGRMLRANPKIELLDLFNTGQGNDGVRELLRGYDEAAAAGVGSMSGLKHLYLDINGITDGAVCAAVANRFPFLETLSLNVNQLGDEGIRELCDNLADDADAPAQLQRLVVGSNGCTDVSLPLLTAVVKRFRNLTVLQLGSYKSTRFFQMRSNSFTSWDGMLELADAVASNARGSENPNVNFLGFQHAYTHSDASELVLAIGDKGVHANGVQWNASGHTTITANQLNELLGCRTNVQPAPVEHIQSVYRNNM